MNELIVREYLGSGIEFQVIDGKVYANALSMTDSVKLDNWKRSKNTINYLEALKNKNLKNSVKFTELIMSTEGRNGGTWIHEKLVLSLARYISVEFELWCDEQIATLIREGSVSIKKDDKASILLAIYNGGIDAVEASRRLTAIEIKPLKDKIKQDEPLVELAKKKIG